MNSSKLFYLASLLLCVFISACDPSPVEYYPSKNTCRHKRHAIRADWAECKGGKPHVDYREAHNRFADEIRSNVFTDAQMLVPTNEMQCFSVRMYNKETLWTESKCPAICKLRDSDEEDDPDCPALENELVVAAGQDKALHTVTIKSPRHPCSIPYRPKEVCLYNISLSCATEHVVISSAGSPGALSSLSLADKDFLEIIDYSRKNTYDRIIGPDSLQRDFHVASTQFVVLFSSNTAKKASGNGFKINMECAIKSTMGDTTQDQGSAAAEILL